LINGFVTDINQIFDINIVVSVSVIQVLEDLKIPELSIKWPNDIMSYSKKIGGILIENSIKSDGTINSIVGLGLNVNQLNFDNLPKASSLSLICNRTFDKDEILLMIIENLEQNIELWFFNSDYFWMIFSNKLFKKGIPMAFEDQNKQNFMGIIQGVSPIGKLEVLLEDDAVSAFDIREIQMLY
jgi:BirA family biotin operon repressor/biotin-[acetyl-CoA-carboxylase] ligase